MFSRLLLHHHVMFSRLFSHSMFSPRLLLYHLMLSLLVSRAMLNRLLIISIIGGSCHEYHFCRDKTLVATNKCCSEKHTFVETKDVFCRDKHTKLLSRQK